MDAGLKRGFAAHSPSRSPRIYRPGAFRKSLIRFTLSSSSYSTRRAGDSSNDHIAAPGYAASIGECVAIMNWLSFSRSIIMPISAN